jgi:tetratricopeptide (TPR) repeat protein
LYYLARFNWMLGYYSAAQVYAHESQRLARISAEPYREAGALCTEAVCLYALGDYKQSISLFNRARNLLGLCGASGGRIDRTIIIHQGEVHKLKSEYAEAGSIHHGLLQEASINRDPYHHAVALLNVAEIGVYIGAPKQTVQGDIQTARKIFNTREMHMEVVMCETTLANLYLREGNMQAAESLLQKCIRLTITDPQILPYCLEQLGDVSRWNGSLSVILDNSVLCAFPQVQREAWDPQGSSISGRYLPC